MIMEIYQIVIFLVYLSSVVAAASTRRHMIYWNSFMTPSLKGDEGYVLDVNIGEFMDILCPQTSLMSITNGPTEPKTFNIFNVTKRDFDRCQRKGRNNFIFACDRPERENKLTIKFQVISPSPLGFRFQYCQEYFFAAFPRGKEDSNGGCSDSTRLHIRVACKDRTITSTTTTTTTPPTTTTSTPQLNGAEDGDEQVVRPEIVDPHLPQRNRTQEVSSSAVKSQVGNNPNGGNAAARPLNSTVFVFLTSLIAVVFTSLMTSPLT